MTDLLYESATLIIKIYTWISRGNLGVYILNSYNKLLLLYVNYLMIERVCVCFYRLVGYPGNYRKLFGLRQEEVTKTETTIPNIFHCRCHCHCHYHCHFHSRCHCHCYCYFIVTGIVFVTVIVIVIMVVTVTVFLNLFYYMCIPHNITTFVFKKNNRIQYITRKEKIKKYYSTVCTYELETVGVLIQ